MRAPLTEDALEDVVLARATSRPQDHGDLARQLLAWADSPHPRDEVTPGVLLVEAGEQLEFAGETDAALAAYRRAVDTGDPVPPDVRCYLFSALMDAGLADEASELAQEVRRSRPADPDVYVFMAEVCEMHDQADEANRWFTRGLLRGLRSHGVEDPGVMTLMVGRLRVRDSLGFPPDEYDDIAGLYLAQAAADTDDDTWEDEDSAEDEDWDGGDVPAAAAGPARNAPCPCGSGRKYKRCCGRDGAADGPRAVSSRQGDDTVIDLF